jgi:hypothetical protein
MRRIEILSLNRCSAPVAYDRRAHFVALSASSDKLVSGYSDDGIQVSLSSVRAAFEFLTLAVGRLLGTTFEADARRKIVDVLLWNGVLGVVRPSGEVAFIYSVNYDRRELYELYHLTCSPVNIQPRYNSRQRPC